MYPGPGRAGKSSIAALAFLLLAEIPAAQLPDAIAVEKNISAAFRAELKGEPLRVGLYEKPPFVQFHSDSSRTGNGRFYGISVEQMNELSSKFNFSVVYYKIRDSAKFDEFIAAVGKGYQNITEEGIAVDVTIQLITALGKRSLAAYLTSSPVDSSLVYATRTDFIPVKPRRPLFSFFTGRLVAVLLAIVLAFALLLSVFRREEGSHHGHSDDVEGGQRIPSQAFICPTWSGARTQEFLRALYDLISLFLGHLETSQQPQSWGSRILMVVFKLYAWGVLLIAGAYIAVNLVFENDKFPATKGLCGVKSPVAIDRLAIANGTSMMEHINNHAKSCLEDRPQYQTCNRSEECLEMVVNGTADATLQDFQFVRFAIENQGKCRTLKIADGHLKTPQATTWAVRLQKPGLGQALSNAILSMRDSDTFLNIENKYIQDTCKDDSAQAADIDELGPFLLIVLGGVAVSGVVLTTEQLKTKKKKRWKKRHAVSVGDCEAGVGGKLTLVAAIPPTFENDFQAAIGSSQGLLEICPPGTHINSNILRFVRVNPPSTNENV